MPNQTAVITFDAELPEQTTAARGYVLRRGKVFEVGEFPDKGFSLTAEEAAAAVASFAPVPANLEHRQTVLDGRLGDLVEVKLADDGKTLLGTLLEPKWLADLLPNGARKVSLEWDKAKKQIVGIAHVLSPRIADAAVFNAYAQFAKGETVAAIGTFGYESTGERDAIADEDFGDPEGKLFPVRTQSEYREAMRELWNAADPTAVKAPR